MSAVVCPYCRDAIEQEESQAVVCPGCGTIHHSDCFEENGGCTVFGCSAAPAPEPKLSIGAPDLNLTASARPVPLVAPAAAAPPRFISSGSAPPLPMGQTAPAATEPNAEDLRPPLFSSLGYGSRQPIAYPSPTPTPIQNARAFDPTLPAKSRTAFLLLGVLLGAFGAHSFYAGSTKKGFIQLVITVLSFGFAGLMVWIWAVIDICTITTDHNGIPFRN
jgi:TM2 domain-containing membrane protein YozV